MQRPLRRALYLQVRDALVERIANGAWKAGIAVANEGDLARELGVSAGTARKALELMEAQRLITRRQGRGTFVSDQTSDDMAARFCKFRSESGERPYSRTVVTDIGSGAASEEERRHLNLAPGEAVYRLQRVQGNRGQTCMVGEAVVPATLFPCLPERREAAVNVVTLAQAAGILLGKGEDRISMRPAPEDVAEVLGVAHGTLVMYLERIVFALDGPALEWSTGYCHAPGCYYLAELS